MRLVRQRLHGFINPWPPLTQLIVDPLAVIHLILPLNVKNQQEW